MHKIKVIIVTTGQDMGRRVKFAVTLARNGYVATILNWDKSGNMPKVEYIDDCRVQNFRFKPPDFGRWSVAACYLIWWCYAFLFLLKDDAKIYHPENLYNLIPAIPVKFLKRKKIIYHLADFAANSFDWPEFIRKPLAYLERFCLKFADGVIIVDEYRKHEIGRASTKKLAVVMNCPGDLMNKFEVQKDKNKFIIYYGGWIMETRGLKQLCEAIGNMGGVKLVIAGTGADEKKLMPIFDAQENIEFKGLLSSKESLEWTAKADVIFAFYDPKIRINRLASPNKLFDAMMCGTSILANSEALPVVEIINKEKCGLLVPYKDIKGIKNAIKWLKDNPDARMEMGQNGRKAFEREYNWDIMEKRLINLYKEAIGAKSNT